MLNPPTTNAEDEEDGQRQGRDEAGLSVISWNVHGLTRAKLEDEDFVNKLAKYDIIFLYETWANKTSDFDLEGYKCYNLYRKFQHRRAKRSSGGTLL